MKGKFLLVSLIICQLSTVTSFAQKKDSPAPPQLPMDSVTRKITYAEVVEAKGVSADTLYRRLVAWFNQFYTNPTEVIREKDDDARKIVGKPRFRISNPPDKNGQKTDAGIVQYTITVAVRDGRFKYEITDVNWKQISYFPAERWYDTSAPSYSKNYPEYLRLTDEQMHKVIGDLKKALTEKKVVKKDEW